MELLVSIIVMILRALLPACAGTADRPALLPGADSATSSVEDGARRPALRNRLRNAVRCRWCLVLVLVLPAGCSTRTIYVPSGEPVRLRQTVRNAKVWVLDKDGQAIAGRMDLPEGWYCLPVEDD